MPKPNSLHVCQNHWRQPSWLMMDESFKELMNEFWCNLCPSMKFLQQVWERVLRRHRRQSIASQIQQQPQNIYWWKSTRWPKLAQTQFDPANRLYWRTNALVESVSSKVAVLEGNYSSVSMCTGTIVLSSHKK